MKLVIEYHAQSDTLWLGNGETASEGEDITENIIVFFRDDRPVAVHIDHAAELLMPILSGRADYPVVDAADNPTIDAVPKPPVESDYPGVETRPNPAGDTASIPAAEVAAGPVGE